MNEQNKTHRLILIIIEIVLILAVIFVAWWQMSLPAEAPSIFDNFQKKGEMNDYPENNLSSTFEGPTSTPGPENKAPELLNQDEGLSPGIERSISLLPKPVRGCV